MIPMLLQAMDAPDSGSWPGYNTQGGSRVALRNSYRPAVPERFPVLGMGGHHLFRSFSAWLTNGPSGPPAGRQPTCFGGMMVAQLHSSGNAISVAYGVALSYQAGFRWMARREKMPTIPTRRIPDGLLQPASPGGLVPASRHRNSADTAMANPALGGKSESAHRRTCR